MKLPTYLSRRWINNFFISLITDSLQGYGRQVRRLQGYFIKDLILDIRVHSVCTKQLTRFSSLRLFTFAHVIELYINVGVVFFRYCFYSLYIRLLRRASSLMPLCTNQLPSYGILILCIPGRTQSSTVTSPKHGRSCVWVETSSDSNVTGDNL